MGALGRRRRSLSDDVLTRLEMQLIYQLDIMVVVGHLSVPYALSIGAGS